MAQANSESGQKPIFPRWRVLIFPGATEIGLELRQALAWRKEVELFSAAAAVSNHASFVFARHFVLPMAGAPGWLEALQKVVISQGITHIFPAHDDALVALAEKAESLAAKIVTSPVETCRIARSKAATLRKLEGLVLTPNIFGSEAEVTDFPVFIKPDRGQGSQRAERANSREELQAFLRSDPDRLIFEFLPGREFTVDCFTDRERGLLYAGGRERRRIRAGIAMDSVGANDSRLLDYARRIGAALEFHGGWFFQVKEDREGSLKVLEVAPRIGGTSAWSRARGVNLPLLSLYEAEREPLSVAPATHSVEIDRALVSRYRTDLTYRALYIDLDDTLIIRGEVNVELMKLLYQSVNRGIRLVLLTRHAEDLSATLRRFRLDGLFDEVVHLRSGEPKAAAIRDKEAVLVDDSFAERTAVHEQTGIPVFDPSMVEVLFDERR